MLRVARTANTFLQQPSVQANARGALSALSTQAHVRKAEQQEARHITPDHDQGSIVEGGNSVPRTEEPSLNEDQTIDPSDDPLQKNSTKTGFQAKAGKPGHTATGESIASDQKDKGSEGTMNLNSAYDDSATGSVMNKAKEAVKGSMPDVAKEHPVQKGKEAAKEMFDDAKNAAKDFIRKE